MRKFCHRYQCCVTVWQHKAAGEVVLFENGLFRQSDALFGETLFERALFGSRGAEEIELKGRFVGAIYDLKKFFWSERSAVFCPEKKVEISWNGCCQRLVSISFPKTEKCKS